MSVTADTELVSTFAFYAALLCIKMFFMSPYTGSKRVKNKVVSNPEDASLNKGAKLARHEEVERVRRAHLNDIENIIPFFTIGFLYCFTSPEIATAKWIFRIFASVRFLHTYVYAINVIPQPARFLVFGVGMFCNLYMARAVMLHFW